MHPVSRVNQTFQLEKILGFTCNQNYGPWLVPNGIRESQTSHKVSLIRRRKLEHVDATRSRLRYFHKRGIRREENEILPISAASILQRKRDVVAGTNLLVLVCRPVLPDKVQQPIVAVCKDYGTFGRAGFHSVRAFVSESTASFKGEQIFGHGDGSSGERVTSSASPALMQSKYITPFPRSRVPSTSHRVSSFLHTMSFSDDLDVQGGWDIGTPTTGDIVQDAIRKEKIIKYVVSFLGLPSPH